MVRAQERTDNSIVLFYAGQSLLLQVADWVHRHTFADIELSGSCGRSAIAAAARGAGFVIIDATEAPDAAVDAIDTAAQEVGSRRVAVYTERPDPLLKMVAKARGGRLLTGPLSQFEWASVLLPVAARGRQEAPMP